MAPAGNSHSSLSLSPLKDLLAMPPFFTIITSTYNAASTLPRLLDSLASQTCRDFNWIVQDGASSDATMRIVEQYRNHLPAIFADSGKDRGIYDAWNKALERWENELGEWIVFLGADDKFHSKNTLENCYDKLNILPRDVSFGAGNIYIIDSTNNTKKEIIVNLDDSFSCRFQGMSFPHSGLFQKKDILLSTKFDTSFQIAGDYDFFLKVLQEKREIYPLNIFVTDMYSGGISSSPQNSLRLEHEIIEIVKKYRKQHKIYYYLAIKYKIKKFILTLPCGRKIWNFIKYIFQIAIHKI